MLFGEVVTLWVVLAAANASKGSSPLELKPEKYSQLCLIRKEPTPGCCHYDGQSVVMTLYTLLEYPACMEQRHDLVTDCDHEDVPGCYLAEYDKVIPLGKEETTPDCVLYKCEDKWLEYYTCDITMNAPDCKLLASPDLTKPYPECCPVFKCFKSKTRTQHEIF